jgi:hypothetical protein
MHAAALPGKAKLRELLEFRGSSNDGTQASVNVTRKIDIMNSQ